MIRLDAHCSDESKHIDMKSTGMSHDLTKEKLPSHLPTGRRLINRNLEDLKPRNTPSRDHKLLLKGVAPLPRMPHREPVPVRETNECHAKRRNGMGLQKMETTGQDVS